MYYNNYGSILIGYILFIILAYIKILNCLDFKYHNNTELGEYLEDFVKNNSKYTPYLNTTLYSIGKTKNKNELWVVEIAATEANSVGKPNVKFVGNVHGNEAVGREVLLHFLEYLRNNYETDSTVQHLLNNTNIHILPSLNPDGFASSNVGICMGEIGRTNSDGLDLNRNFPDYYHTIFEKEQLETKAVRQWMSNIPFILSAALHGGAVVANYPFDTVKEESSNPKRPSSLTPDNDVFKYLATVYAKNHKTMQEGKSCPGRNDHFKNGITNGAAWYPLFGGMQDYNYAFHGCMELTLEISCCKYPSVDFLPELWDENKQALLQYSLQALQGVYGIILNHETNKPITNANITINGRNIVFHSTSQGEFWRILLPGKYILNVVADGYHNYQVSFTIPKLTNKLPTLTRLNIHLLNITIATTTTTAATEKTSIFTTKSFDNSKTTEDNDESKNQPLVGESSINNKAEHFKNYFELLVLFLVVCLRT